MGNHTEDVHQRLRQGLESAVEYLDQSPSLIHSWLPLEVRARLDAMDRRMKHAAQLFGASWTQREVENWPPTEFERPDYEESVNTVRSALGDEIFDQLFEKGKGMTLKDALVFALEEII